MATLNFPKLPDSFMFRDDKGNPVKLYMTVEWQEFFRGLFERSGGETEINVNADDVIKLLFATKEPKLYDKKIEELRKLIELIPVYKNYDKEIAEIKKMIIGGI